jgi:hypothetical protein
MHYTITIEKGASDERPLFLDTYLAQVLPGAVVQTLCLNVVEDAHLTIVQRLPSSLPKIAITYMLGARAQVTVLNRSDLVHNDAPLEYGVQVIGHEESSFEMHGLITAAGRYDFTFEARGRFAQANIALVLASAHKKIYLHSLQHHSAQDTTSRFSVRGVLGGKGYGAHEGMIHIAPQAVNADAAQESKFLLESLEARAYTKPMLEVLTNKVRCAHGSAIGFFEEELLIYCALRGMSKTVGRQLIAHGFLAQNLPAALQHPLADALKRALEEPA